MVPGATGLSGWALAAPTAASAPIEATEARSNLRMNLLLLNREARRTGVVEPYWPFEVEPLRPGPARSRPLKTGRSNGSNVFRAIPPQFPGSVAPTPHLNDTGVKFLS